MNEKNVTRSAHLVACTTMIETAYARAQAEGISDAEFEAGVRRADADAMDRLVHSRVHGAPEYGS